MDKPKIIICIGSSCFSRGNTKNVEIAEKYLEENGYRDEVDLDLSGSLCQGRCADGPIVLINDRVYNKVDTGLMLDLLQQVLPPKNKKETAVS